MDERSHFQCDGKDFQDEYRDEWLDSMILGDSEIGSIFRFRGCDIKHHIEDLLYIISSKEPSFFGERGRNNLARLACDEVTSKKLELGEGIICVRYRDQDSVDNDQIRIELRTKNIPEVKREFWKSRYNYAKEIGGGELDSVISRYQAEQKLKFPDKLEPSIPEGIEKKTDNAAEAPESKRFCIEEVTVDRELVVVALQALWRERTTAYNAALTVSSLNGTPSPNKNLFAISEVTEALRRIGEGPPTSSYGLDNDQESV